MVSVDADFGGPVRNVVAQFAESYASLLFSISLNGFSEIEKKNRPPKSEN